MRVIVCFVCMLPVIGFAVEVQVAERPSIAIIGTGDMADSLGPRLAQNDYLVVYGSRDPDSASSRALREVTGPDASVTLPDVAVQQAGIVALAVPWYGLESVLESVGDLNNKIVIDMIGVWEQGEDGYPERALTDSSAITIQERFPRARIVKSFATAGSNIIDNPGQLGGVVSMPVAADDREAKERVARIVATLGFDPVDFGPLRMAVHIESLQAVWLTPAFQRRSAGYELYLRKSPWPCEWNLDGWSQPASDAGSLARMPDKLPANACNAAGLTR